MRSRLPALVAAAGLLKPLLRLSDGVLIRVRVSWRCGRLMRRLVRRGGLAAGLFALLALLVLHAAVYPGPLGAEHPNPVGPRQPQDSDGAADNSTMLNGAQAATVDTARGPVEVARAGAGEPVLFIHGTPGGWDSSLAMGRFLAEAGFEVIAPARPGYQG